MEVKIANEDLKKLIENFAALCTAPIAVGVKNHLEKTIDELVKHHTAFNKSLVELIQKSPGAEQLKGGNWQMRPENKSPEFITEEAELMEQTNTVITDVSIDYAKIENFEFPGWVSCKLLNRYGFLTNYTE